MRKILFSVLPHYRNTKMDFYRYFGFFSEKSVTTRFQTLNYHKNWAVKV
jgi:hypothetical protein